MTGTAAAKFRQPPTSVLKHTPCPWPPDALISPLHPAGGSSVEPQAYFAELLTRLVNGWPQARIDELMPWHWAAAKSS